jgi:hypothetical protein
VKRWAQVRTEEMKRRLAGKSWNASARLRMELLRLLTRAAKYFAAQKRSRIGAGEHLPHGFSASSA